MMVGQQQMRCLSENLPTAQQQLQDQDEKPQPMQLVGPESKPDRKLATHGHVTAVPLRRGPLRRIGRLLNILGSRMRPQVS
jgi:hypothetical protein